MAASGLSAYLRVRSAVRNGQIRNAIGPDLSAMIEGHYFLWMAGLFNRLHQAIGPFFFRHIADLDLSVHYFCLEIVLADV